MGVIIEKDKGWTEAVLDNNCGFEKFYAAADIIEKDLEINFIGRVNDFDSFYWDFNFRGSLLILHYNIYFGLSIFPKAFDSASEEDNNKVLEIAGIVFDKLTTRENQ